MVSSAESHGDKKSSFVRFKAGSGENKDLKEKQRIPKEKPIKEKKAKKKEKNPSDGKKKTVGGLFGSSSKKKPRAEYQAEIDTLTSQLQEIQSKLEATERQLQETQTKYDQLQRWAKNPPISTK